MDLAIAADIVSARIREYAAKHLCKEFPSMNANALDKLLDQATLFDGILEQVPAMEAAKPRISFLSLAAEIRNEIYKYVLLSDAVDRSKKTRKGLKSSPILINRDVRDEVPPLLQVCQQTRNEASAMHYYYTSLSFDLFTIRNENTRRLGIRNFLKVAGPERAALIKRVDLVLDHVRPEETVRAAVRQGRNERGRPDTSVKEKVLMAYGLLGLGVKAKVFKLRTAHSFLSEAKLVSLVEDTGRMRYYLGA
ncbi:hypothetical protein HII31_03598 [Pseudocercospora fuligena]|uniref:2EXR domain-containing protein n=1 Tax=Pseudocercospora fuligena TaxID=685502 RepID=A0A8H6VKK5_9PEZI|nr:hypothetical protein HII31_03598 [Pseudocercospora fuligena]